MADETETETARPRRMALETAEDIFGNITSALARLNAWQNDHPKVADFRIEELATGLRRAQKLAGWLRDDIDPDGDAARAAWRERDPRD